MEEMQLKWGFMPSAMGFMPSAIKLLEPASLLTITACPLWTASVESAVCIVPA
jgi:hypothetical protein